MSGIYMLHNEAAFAQKKTGNSEPSICVYNKNNELESQYKLADFTSENNVNQTKLRFLGLSNTDKYFLFSLDCSQPYRNSTTCTYYLGTKSGKIFPISNASQYFPTFSSKDKYVAYVKGNDLFYKNLETETEVQITKDGEWNKIINGKSDWVYEEEFSLTHVFKWNAQSNKIAYLKFDESNVKSYSMSMYNGANYPSLYTYKYPKVGEENAKVSLWYYDLKKKKNKPIKLTFSYEYLPRIYWNGDEIVAMLLNRHQDTLRLVAYSLSTKKTKLLYEESSSTYIDIPSGVHFLSDKSFFIISEKNGFWHIYHYDKNGNLIQQITNGNYEVNRMYFVNEGTKELYFQSNEGNATETSIYCINYNTLEKKKISTQTGSNDIAFSPTGDFYFQTYSSDSIAPTITLIQTKTNKSINFIDNIVIQDSLRNIPRKTFFKIPTKNDTLNAWIIQPKTSDTITKLPLLIYVYGGPHSQTVVNKWQSSRDLFFNFLAENGIAVACIDNKGTDGRGSTFKKSTYLNLGKLEVEDQTQSANYLGKLPFIDSNRIGIFGWSYGGFMAANCLFASNDIFKVGIAVAPVSDWRFYDNIYTERYMRTPEENPKGYQAYNPIALAKNLIGKFLLIHGTADDNVHFQHSIELVNSLNEANKTYQFYMYPDKNHGIGGAESKFDVYNKIFQFLKENL